MGLGAGVLLAPTIVWFRPQLRQRVPWVGDKETHQKRPAGPCGSRRGIGSIGAPRIV